MKISIDRPLWWLDRPWWRFVITVEVTDFVVVAEVQLLPTFIWRQDVIQQDHRIADVQFHNRIVGIDGWPALKIYAGHPSKKYIPQVWPSP